MKALLLHCETTAEILSYLPKPARVVGEIRIVLLQRRVTLHFETTQLGADGAYPILPHRQNGSVYPCRPSDVCLVVQCYLPKLGVVSLRLGSQHLPAEADGQPDAHGASWTRAPQRPGQHEPLPAQRHRDPTVHQAQHLPIRPAHSLRLQHRLLHVPVVVFGGPWSLAAGQDDQRELGRDDGRRGPSDSKPHPRLAPDQHHRLPRARGLRQPPGLHLQHARRAQHPVRLRCRRLLGANEGGGQEQWSDLSVSEDAYEPEAEGEALHWILLRLRLKSTPAFGRGSFL